MAGKFRAYDCTLDSRRMKTSLSLFGAVVSRFSMASSDFVGAGNQCPRVSVTLGAHPFGRCDLGHKKSLSRARKQLAKKGKTVSAITPLTVRWFYGAPR